MLISGSNRQGKGGDSVSVLSSKWQSWWSLRLSFDSRGVTICCLFA